MLIFVFKVLNRFTGPLCSFCIQSVSSLHSWWDDVRQRDDICLSFRRRALRIHRIPCDSQVWPQNAGYCGEGEWENCQSCKTKASLFVSGYVTLDFGQGCCWEFADAHPSRICLDGVILWRHHTHKTTQDRGKQRAVIYTPTGTRILDSSIRATPDLDQHLFRSMCTETPPCLISAVKLPLQDGMEDKL